MAEKEAEKAKKVEAPSDGVLTYTKSGEINIEATVTDKTP